jgi:hypothetical protein
MTRILACIALLLAAWPASAQTGAADAALREARRAGTVAAYDRFLARHGKSPLARTARQERERLRRQPAPAAPIRPEPPARNGSYQ